jgi:predicted O-methyltransferase YrrM/chaperonin cofactor prefoldin
MAKSGAKKPDVVLGGYLRSMQGDPVRHGYMQLLVDLAVRARGNGGPIRILEIGSWAGGSAITWANGIERFAQRNGQVICVDPWREYLDLEVNDDLIYTEMEDALAREQIYPLFQKNIEASGYNDLITEIRGSSFEILPILAKDSFDIIFLDGSHDYENVLHDLQLSESLLRDGGILCGDDLELQSGECADLEHDGDNPIADYVVDAKTEKGFHPGVTRAVGEFIGPVSSWSGFWAMRRAADGFKPVEIDKTKAQIPDHFIMATDGAPAVPLPQTSRFLESHDQYNFLETSDGFLAIAHSVGDIGSLFGPLCSYDLPPVLIQANTIETLRMRVSNLIKSTTALDISQKEAIANKDSRIAALQEAIADKDSRFAALQEAIADKDTRFAALQEATADKDTRFAALQEAIADKDSRFAALQEAIADKDTRFAALQEAIADKDSRFAALQEAIADKDSLIAALQEAIANDHATIADLNVFVAELKRR